MKEQQENNIGNLGQITFKLSAEERQIIDKMVASSGLNLSEYCRIKCLMDENSAIAQRNRIAELEHEIKTLKVKLSCNNTSAVGTNDILLKLNEQQRNLLERLYGNFSSYYTLERFKTEVEDDLGYNILYALICIPQTAYFDDKTADGEISSVFENKDFEYWTPVIEEAFPEMHKEIED